MNRRSFFRSLAGAPLVAGVVAAAPKALPSPRWRDYLNLADVLERDVIYMAAIDIGIIIPGEILSRNTLAHFWHELRLIVAEWNSKGGGPPWVDLNNADTRRMLRYELSGRTTPLYINGWVIRPTS